MEPQRHTSPQQRQAANVGQFRPPVVGLGAAAAAAVVSNPFGSPFSGMPTVASANNPLLMSTLQQLSGLGGATTAGNSGFFPSTSQIGGFGPFGAPTVDMGNEYWRQQTTNWFDHANKAAVAASSSFSLYQHSDAAAAAAAAAQSPVGSMQQIMNKSNGDKSDSLQSRSDSRLSCHGGGGGGGGGPSPCGRQQTPLLSSAAQPSPSQAIPQSPATSAVAVNSPTAHSPLTQPTPSSMHHTSHVHQVYMDQQTASGDAEGIVSQYSMPSTSQNQTSQLLDPTFEDIASWTKDIDLTEFNSLGVDLFGSNKLSDGIHSVLEFDPAALIGDESHGAVEKSNRTTPPPSNATPLNVTPKLREKMKMRREKELAEADKEFERLLSIVAEKNSRTSTSLANLQLPPVLPLPAEFERNFDSQAPSTSDDQTQMQIGMNMSPVQFTPPDSPVGNDVIPVESSFAIPISSSAMNLSSGRSIDDVLLFIPKVDNKSTKSNKVPVYKQVAASASVADQTKRETVDVEHEPIVVNDDEYSFTDEDEEVEVVQPTSSVDQLKEQKLEAEVAQKLARISTMHPELRASAQQRLAGAGQFVPGIGQSPSSEQQQQQQQDLWRHVVPKKRHSTTVNSSLDRPTVPSTPLLPPASVSEAPPSVDARSQASRESAEPEQQRAPLTAAQQLAETLRRRRERRSANCFVRTEICLDDTSTAKPTPPPPAVAALAASMSRVKEEPASDDDQPSSFLQPHSELLSKSGEGPPLPKVIIRIPKRCISQSSHRSSDDGQERKKKKKKKHKHRDEDGERRHKRKKQKKEKRRLENLEGLRHSPAVSSDRDSEGEDPLWHPGSQKASSSAPSAVFNKKKRLMQWNDESTASTVAEEAATERYTSGGKKDKKHHHKKSKRLAADRRDSVEDMAAVDLRLSHFSQPTGTLQRGTFVVGKLDILKADCPLWRVDNQNLLQKFLPEVSEISGRITYKNSSTYSGWCDVFSEKYLVVQVRFIKHTRSETIVEPEIPLADLFPAISCEVTEGELMSGGALSPPECDQHPSAQQQPLRDAMDTYLQALIHHAMSGTFLRTVRDGNDWKFLRHMNDIDRLNLDRKSKLLMRVKWSQKYKELVDKYPLCSIADAEGHGLTCQGCNGRSVEKVVQLFANEAYDYETLDSLSMRSDECGSPLPSLEYLVCLVCANITCAYHKLHHMRYHIYKRCEDKVELLRDENPTLEPSAILDLCIKNRSWVSHLVQEYFDLWKRVADNEF
uniref:DUF4211 domain-containing protein n=1 Tax=Plectus sambesii TaxID=2011161 RepID=A0A914USZ3_9BILA